MHQNLVTGPDNPELENVGCKNHIDNLDGFQIHDSIDFNTSSVPRPLGKPSLQITNAIYVKAHPQTGSEDTTHQRLFINDEINYYCSFSCLKYQNS